MTEPAADPVLEKKIQDLEQKIQKLKEYYSELSTQRPDTHPVDDVVAANLRSLDRNLIRLNLLRDNPNQPNDVLKYASKRVEELTSEMNQRINLNEQLTATVKILQKNERLISDINELLNRIDKMKNVDNPPLSPDSIAIITELAKPYQNLRDHLVNNPPFNTSSKEFLAKLGAVEIFQPPTNYFYRSQNLGSTQNDLTAMHNQLANEISGTQFDTMVSLVFEAGEAYVHLDRMITQLSRQNENVHALANRNPGSQEQPDAQIMNLTKPVTNHVLVFEMEVAELQRLQLKQLNKQECSKIGDERNSGFISDKEAKQAYSDLFKSEVDKLRKNNSIDSKPELKAICNLLEGTQKVISPENINKKSNVLDIHATTDNYLFKSSVIEKLEEARAHYLEKNDKRTVKHLDKAIQDIKEINANKLNNLGLLAVAGPLADLKKYNSSRSLFSRPSNNHLGQTLNTVIDMTTKHDQKQNEAKLKQQQEMQKDTQQEQQVRVAPSR